MMTDVSRISFTVKNNPLGKRESLTFDWEGKSPYVMVAPEFLRVDEIKRIRDFEEIQIGPYRLLLVEREPWKKAGLYVRKDRFGALRVALYKATRSLDLFYRRLIVTLAVWNLAEFSPAAIPSWQDIKIVKRFLKK